MKWMRTILVIFGALIITALGIDAADTLQGSESTLLSKVVKTATGPCPEGMSEVTTIGSLTCVDTFEVSTGAACPEQEPNQVLASQRNIESSACLGESRSNENPWRFVTRDQAAQLCARSGKRLPTSEEWYLLTLGMSQVEQVCNISSGSVKLTGSHNACVSPLGAYDLVGNVWEWVHDDVINGTYKNFQVPESGYVAQVDGGGMATLTHTEAQELFGSDYFWSRTDGAYGIIRGGYYDSGTDAGVYTVHADTLPTTASPGIGFRCVR